MSYIPANAPVVSAVNSTTAALGGGAVFTGTAEDVLAYQSVTIALSVTGALATGTLNIEFSIDGATWPAGLSNSIFILANTAARQVQVVLARFFRTRYVNDAVAQASFSVQAILDGSKIAVDTTHPSDAVTDQANAVTTKSILVGQHENGIYEQVLVDPTNALTVAVTWPLSAFSELLTVQPTPQAQIDGSSLALPSTQTAAWLASGAASSVAMSGNKFQVQCGTSATGVAYLQSRETLRYRTGQGNAGRFTTIFDGTPRASNDQCIGLLSPENGFAVGYNGTIFGFLRRTGGRREIQTLTVTAAATAADVMTVTLDGVAVVLPAATAAAAGSTANTAYFISQQTYSTTGRGWQASAAGATVIFIAGWAANLVGAFTLAGGTSAGAFAETAAGASPTDTWTPQTTWNVDRLDGSKNALNPSGQLLVPTNGNVWQVSYQWLGYGAIVLGAEDTSTGRLIPVHLVQYNNTSANTSVENPNLPIRMESRNYGNVNQVTLQSPSLETYVQGTPVLSGARFSYSAFRAAVGTSLVPIFSLRVRPVFGGRLNLSQIVLAAFSASGQGANCGRVTIVFNGVLAGVTPVWVAVNSDSMTDVDVTATTISGGTEIQTLTTGGNSCIGFDLSNFSTTLAYGDVISVCAQSRAGTTDFGGTVAWFEDR